MKPLRPLLALAAVLWANSLLGCQSSPTAAPNVPNSMPHLDGVAMAPGTSPPGAPSTTESAPTDSAGTGRGLGVGSGH